MSNDNVMGEGSWSPAHSLRDITAGVNVLVAFPSAAIDNPAAAKVIDWRPCRVTQDCKKKGNSIIVETVNGGLLEIRTAKAVMVWKEKKK